MSEELQILPIEEQISQELVKQNVTEAIIATLKENYGHLKVSGIDDKETYLQIKEGRKKCKELRVMAKKICEKGREEAVSIQKAWVAKQKEVTDQISAIEDPLEEQEKAYEAAVAKDKADRQRRQEEQLILRQQVLTGMGVLYSGGSFILGEVSFELSLVKESEQDIWEESILPKFKEEYEKVEAERIEQERIKQEREAEMKRQQEELERKQKELEQKEAELKFAKEEQERKLKEDADKKEAEAKAYAQRIFDARCNELVSLGMIKDWPNKLFSYGGDVNVSEWWIIDATESAWREMIEEVTAKVEIKKAEAEQKRLAEIEEQKELERVRALGKSRMGTLDSYNATTEYTVDALGKLDDVSWEIVRCGWQDAYDAEQKRKWEKEQEETRKQEELLQQQKMEQAKDKEKWEEMMHKINEVVVYEMRSSQYRKKAMILREKLEEIKAL